ncbi:aryl-alcohol dehydrogenase-like predicted oxidoreductase [Thermonema lapsum]|uniref:Aryl-alcohol dehydrogenase-like predicted oxidoreductase n=1 Tax=Thermonema lapsum TaxID=28195 RepID=A0A846MSG7_9BACT|nr:aldo/keto reductase [Thermonema lapsum]NIK74197.1 aryl-alcohol dehydrogenase-like predicted oxidoreductase [Thermonema lapsum]
MMKYKLFGKSGLRVSELCLGTMTFGEEWGTGANKEESRKIFEAFVEQGGNFFDTANRYTEGTSEKWLGEFVKPQRDRYVIATKYTLYDDRTDPNAMGNHRKNMMRSVEGSLRRLNTDYIDILWVHMWDFTTPIEEVMRGLDDLVSAGKVHYIGISDTPAWIVAKANTLAEWRGWTPFIGLQIEYSLIQRTPEADLLPMAHHFDMCITPWSPLGAGLLTGKYNDGQIEGKGRLSPQSRKVTERNLHIARQVGEIANKLGVPASQVALNWLRRRHPQIIPIVGARRVEQLRESMGCLNWQLSEEHFRQLDEVSRVDLGFPHEFLRYDSVQDVIFGDHKHSIENHRLNR